MKARANDPGTPKKVKTNINGNKATPSPARATKHGAQMKVKAMMVRGKA